MFSLFPVEVSFPWTTVRGVEPVAFEMLAQMNAMDTARLQIDMEHKQMAEFISAGSPIRVRWGKRDSFIGYVHSFRPKTDGYRKRTEILAISAAYPMLNESGKTYYKAGIHNVAQQTGDRYRFQVETDPHPFTHEQILQKGDSDWALLYRLGQQWGYVVMMTGVTLIFRPLRDLLDENMRFTARNRTPVGVTTLGAELTEFEPSFSASDAASLSRVSFQGVDPVTTQAIRQEVDEGDAVFSEVSNQRAITSDVEGEMKREAVWAEKRFPFRAQARLQFPFRKRPLDIYRITHQNETMTWAILSIKHIVTEGSYEAEVEFGSDGTDPARQFDDDRLDISTLLKRKKRAKRPKPMIVNSRPYFVGTGASAVVADQRWKARIMTIPREEENV